MTDNEHSPEQPRLNIERWERLRKAVDEGDWDAAEMEALRLSGIKDMKKLKHVEGIYNIGSQGLRDAPKSTREAIDEYHSALIMMRKKTRQKRKKKG